MFREKMLQEGEEVLLPVSQRREAQANAIDSKIQFRSKSPRFDFFLQITQCRGDDAKAAGIPLLRPPVREEIEERLLTFEIQFIDSVQKNGSLTALGIPLRHPQARFQDFEHSCVFGRSAVHSL